jgi:hypothetical protein
MIGTPDLCDPIQALGLKPADSSDLDATPLNIRIFIAALGDEMHLFFVDDLNVILRFRLWHSAVYYFAAIAFSMTIRI